MKNLLFGFILLCIIASCKKDGGKYCPEIIRSREANVDLSEVSWIPGVMDTLSKYPQLQVSKVYFGTGYAPGSYFANIHCNIYYKHLRIMNSVYFWHISNQGGDFIDQKSVIPVFINISLEPAITLQQANTIARETFDFAHCTVSELGINRTGPDSLPEYNLIWRIVGAESGYPIVELDAQNGNVSYAHDGWEH